jgi:hypothetical protein
MRFNKYYRVDQFKVDEGTICVAHMGQMRNAKYFWEVERKRPFRRTRRNC